MASLLARLTKNRIKAQASGQSAPAKDTNGAMWTALRQQLEAAGPALFRTLLLGVVHSLPVVALWKVGAMRAFYRQQPMPRDRDLMHVFGASELCTCYRS